MSGLWRGPWPSEDGGPRRDQAPDGLAGVGIGPEETLVVTAWRDALAATMLVLRAPGELFVLRHELGRRPLRDPVDAWVEQIDPVTLATIKRSPMLAGGPFWPGGMAVLEGGAIVVVFGRHCHRLSAELELVATRRLPQARPYNSFVVLGDGTLAMKDLDRDLRRPARVTLLHPETLEPRCEEVGLPESSIARLTADGSNLYVVGVTAATRLTWDGVRLTRDEQWRVPYHGGPDHSYGWDPVVAGGHLWFLDNGDHDYVTTMRGAGRSRGPVRLVRASLDDAGDWEAIEVCGRPRGAVTNPPLYDPERQIAVAYDSANGVVQAFRHDGALTPLWRRELSHAAHMIRFPDTGELVLGDFRGLPGASSPLVRALARRWSGPAGWRWARRAASLVSGEDVVVVDIETGSERARARVPSMFQSVLFPAPGFDRDVYWCTFSSLARLTVAPLPL